MSTKILCLFVLISTLLQNGHTFWWQPTTKSPETVLKQIPLTYFRTYTYQPLAANPFAYPFFGGNPGGFAAPPFVPQSPLLSGSRYDAAPPQPRPEPTTTSTTTTSTTTTTTPPPPPPTTTTTTSTTSTTTTTPAPPTTKIGMEDGNWHETSASPQNGGDHPAYNRRLYSSAFNQLKIDRPTYPYPEYSAFHPSASKLDTMTPGHRSSPQIQFVPCMCPISVGLTAEMGSKTGFRDNFMAETRTAVHNDAEMELPQDQEVTNLSIGKDEGGSSASAEKSPAEEFRRSGEAQLINRTNLEPIEKLGDDQRTHAELV